MKHLDLFSGYGGFTIPARKYNIETIGFSEIDKYACSVLNYHYPNIKNYGDITKIKAEDLPTVDIITGGSPCQDLSVAGKGAGLNGERSGLFFHFIRLIKEKQPTYFVWENVKGALSSQGGWDFARVQIEMEQAGYDVWWQVLNAKDFGVPQNRERIFAIGIRKGSGREILFEQRESRQNPKQIIKGSQGSRVYDDSIAVSQKALGGGQGAKTGLYAIESFERKDGFKQTEESPTISSTYYKRVQYNEGEPAIAIYRGRPNMPYEKGKRTLKYERYDKECPALTQNCATGDQKNMVAVPNSNGNIHSLDANYWKGSDNPNKSRRSQILVSKKRRKEYSLQEQSPALTSHYRGFPDGDGRPAILKDMRIRRLTPIEAERLMGLEDNWTAKGIIDGKEVDISDTQRYKMCGNGVVVNVVDYVYKLLIGEK